MTLPLLIQKNNNRVVETRLMKFYSSINQAVKMAEVDYGDKKYWYEDLAGAELDKDGNQIPGSSKSEKWFRKYIAPYIKYTKIEAYNKTFRVYFPDGTVLQPSAGNTRDWTLFMGNPNKCKEYFLNPTAHGKCSFAFAFYPASEDESWQYNVDKGFEPFVYHWDGTEKALYDGCKGVSPNCGSIGNFCTALIRYNNWKIPDDYPYKVSY